MGNMNNIIFYLMKLRSLPPSSSAAKLQAIHYSEISVNVYKLYGIASQKTVFCTHWREYRKCPSNKFACTLTSYSGSGSSVGIATDYGLDGPGIESRRGRDFSPVQTGPGAHPASYKLGTRFFPRVKCGRGVLLTIHPLLALRYWKSRAILLTPSGPQPGL
jgi:hypothetical protein